MISRQERDGSLSDSYLHSFSSIGMGCWGIQRGACCDETIRGKIIFFGNRGSAADSQHLAAEFVSRFQFDRRSLLAIAFTTNTSILTAVSNDWAFEEIFARQVQALVGRDDLVIGIGAGGNSKNVLRGMEEAKKKGARTVGFIGKGGGKLAKLADISTIVRKEERLRRRKCKKGRRAHSLISSH